MRSLARQPPRVGPMLPDRQAQLVGYLGVGGRRVGHQQFDQPLPLPGQAGQGRADGLVAFVGEQALVGLGLVCGDIVERGIIGNRHDFLARR